jgi:predicted aldo/keto reductase-like oxidoreductase
MRRFDFDTVLVALNVADVHRLSFARTVLVEAGRRGMGVIGMKVYAAGILVHGGGSPPVTSAEAMGYVLSLAGVSTVIIGCSSPAEVDDNTRNARSFQPFEEPTMRALEKRTYAHAGLYTSYKNPA